MKAAIYRIADGLVTRRISCHPSQMEIQAQDGEGIYPDCPDDATHVIDNKPVTIGPVREQVLMEVRDKRGRLLSSCDWTQLPDSPLSPDKRQEWAAYRQALRDLPSVYAVDPDSIVWPTPP